MYRVTLKFADGHTFSRLVYADGAAEALELVGHRFPPDSIVCATVEDITLQIHEIRDRVMAAIDSQRSGAQS